MLPLVTAVALVGCSGAAPKTAPTSLRPMPSGGGGSLAAGSKFTLAATPEQVVGFGSNASGELGEGAANVPRPVRVAGLHGEVVALAAGSSFSFALLADGSVWGWGHDASGQLGDGKTTDRNVPKQIKGLRDVRAIAGGKGFAMALEADGRVLAWGNNQSGQLGDGNAPLDHASPAEVRGLGAGSGVVQVAAGGSFGMVLKSNGSVLEWGNGTSGQLGNGARDKQSAPTQVKGLGPGSGVVAIAGGGSHAIALKSDGTVLAWGNNQSGQLGDGTAPADHSAPVVVAGLGAGSGVTMIAAGDSFSLAAKSDGTVLAWGNNQSGQLGDGTAPADHFTPVAVAGLDRSAPVRALAAGGSHSVALLDNGSIWAWGNNSAGQLGDGSMPTDQPSPVQAVRARS